MNRIAHRPSRRVDLPAGGWRPVGHLHDFVCVAEVREPHPNALAAGAIELDLPAIGARFFGRLRQRVIEAVRLEQDNPVFDERGLGIEESAARFWLAFGSDAIRRPHAVPGLLRFGWHERSLAYSPLSGAVDRGSLDCRGRPGFGGRLAYPTARSPDARKMAGLETAACSRAAPPVNNRLSPAVGGRCVV